VGALLFSAIRKGMGSPKIAETLLTPAAILSRWAERWGELRYAVHLALA
jgi:hypothetical protein